MTCEHRATKEVCCDCDADLEFDGPAQLRRELERFAKENFDLHAVAMFVTKQLTKWYRHDEGHHRVISELQKRINELEEELRKCRQTSPFSF
jgi:hypothetical protein